CNRFLRLHDAEIGYEVHAYEALAAERIRVVIDALRSLGWRALVARGNRPLELVRRSVVCGLLYPAYDFERWDASRDALLVALFGTGANLVEHFVGIPVLGVVVFDVAGLDIADRDKPVGPAGGQDQAQRVIGRAVAHRLQQATSFLGGNESEASRQRESG